VVGEIYPYSVIEEVNTMTTKINPPEFKGKAYERYKRELKAWVEVTELVKKKRGFAIAL